MSLKLHATVDQCHTVIPCHVNCTHLNKCLNIYILQDKKKICLTLSPKIWVFSGSS